MSEYNEYYINRSPTTAGAAALKWWHRRMLMIARRFIPDFKSKTILEVGAGHGFFAEACQQYKIVYCGYEMNEPQAKLLNQNGYDVSPATVPPIPVGKSAQVIWLSHVLEHAKDYHAAKEMLTACYNRLEQGGHLVIIAPDIHHWKTEFWSVDWSHGFPTSLNRVEQLLNETGFSIQKSMHHTFTVTNPFFSWLISSLLRVCFPATLIDFILYKFTQRKFAHSFMSVFGLRQIYLIGQKN